MICQLGRTSLSVALTAVALVVLLWPPSSTPAPLSAAGGGGQRSTTGSCGGSGWRRVGYLNMSDPAQSCPEGWREIATPRRRTCGRNISGIEMGCSTVVFSTSGERYKHVCGKILGYQFSQTMAFAEYNRHPDNLTIDDAYVDGVSVTHGSPREHVWTLASAWSELTPGDNSSCPCTSPATSAISVPPWVGIDYFCDTAASGAHGFPPAIFFENDTLWDDGRGCSPASTCCEVNSPPVFCRALPQSTRDDIEVRLCGTDGYERVDTPIELIEIYVR